jgi:hypothetical protein
LDAAEPYSSPRSSRSTHSSHRFSPKRYTVEYEPQQYLPALRPKRESARQVYVDEDYEEIEDDQEEFSLKNHSPLEKLPSRRNLGSDPLKLTDQVSHIIRFHEAPASRTNPFLHPRHRREGSLSAESGQAIQIRLLKIQPSATSSITLKPSYSRMTLQHSRSEKPSSLVLM